MPFIITLLQDNFFMFKVAWFKYQNAVEFKLVNPGWVFNSDIFVNGRYLF